MSIVQPYLFFDGRCEEAIEYYQNTLNAEITALMRYKDSPDPNMCMPGKCKQSVGVRSCLAGPGRFVVGE